MITWYKIVLWKKKIVDVIHQKHHSDYIFSKNVTYFRRTKWINVFLKSSISAWRISKSNQWKLLTQQELLHFHKTELLEKRMSLNDQHEIRNIQTSREG